MATINQVNSVEAPPNKLEQNTEEIQITDDGLSPSMDEEAFGRAVDAQIQRANEYWEALRLKTRQETNAKYWEGYQIDTAKIRDDLEKGVENAIFRNLETMIPIATSRTPEVSATPAYKNEQTRDFGMRIKKILQTEWEVYQGMQKKVGQGIRNHQINLLGVFQIGFDPDTKEYWTEELPATDFVISKKGDFVARYVKDKTLGDLIEKFPEKKEKILEQLGYRQAWNKELADSPVQYIEAWTDELVGWKLGPLVLGVDKNPHFDYEGKMIPQMNPLTGEPLVDPATGGPLVDPQTGQAMADQVFYNHFKKPKKPFLFLTYFNRGVHLFDDTSLIEQGIGPQDWINKRKRQIGANADSTNGHWVSSGDFIAQEEFAKIEGSIDEKIWLAQGKPGDGFVKVTGQPLPDYIYNDLVDSRQALDNIMGTHATTRGDQSNNPTLGQDVMQKESDFGRVDGYVRDCIEAFSQQWYEYMYHMYLVYGKEDKEVAVPEDDDIGTDTIVFSRNAVPIIRKKDGYVCTVPMIMRVKQGSTLPEDDAFRYHKAFQIRDMMAPIDFFKMIGESNPRELYKNKLIYDVDPYTLIKDDPDIIELAQKQAQIAQGQAEQAAQAEAGKQKGQMEMEQMKNDAAMQRDKMKMDGQLKNTALNQIVGLMGGGQAV